MIYKIRADVWLYPGMSGWHFVSVPKGTAAEIKKEFGARARGWGSLPVTVTLTAPHRRSGQVAAATWKTSIFPDKKTGTYLLPLKAAVRKKAGIKNGDTITFSLSIRA